MRKNRTGGRRVCAVFGVLAALLTGCSTGTGRNTARFTLAADYAAMVVVVPVGAETACDGKRLLLGGKVVDFNAPQTAAK